MKKLLISVSLIILSYLMADPARACTIFRLTAADGSILVARSMEFGVDLHYDLIVVPRGKSFTSPFLKQIRGLTWSTRYGYIGVASLGLDYGISDGMNETGLSVGVLWYENTMKWQDVVPADSLAALASEMFPDWILGNFALVEEVKAAVQQIKVFAWTDSTLMKSVPSLHFIVYDAAGGCLVIEFDEGVCHIYDNPLGIMTNAPSFPWQLENLRQYTGMSAQNSPPLTLAGQTLVSTGHGQGMWGLPGDYTPPSRFVRLAVLTHFSDQQTDASGNLNLCQHILNTFTIPRGIIVDKDPEGKIISAETTQWATFRDLTNRILYFKTYDNHTLRKIDLSALDFSVKDIRRLEMFETRETVIDLTGTIE